MSRRKKDNPESQLSMEELSEIAKAILASPITLDQLFKATFSEIRCFQLVVDSIRIFRGLDLKVKAIEKEKHLMPTAGGRQYGLDLLAEMEDNDEVGKMYIDLEMQNAFEGTEFIRAETYASAVRMEVNVPGSKWSQLPKVATIMFVRVIPEGEDLYYLESFDHRVGYAGDGSVQEFEDRLNPIIYVRLGLENQTELLNKHPWLRPLARITHDLQKVYPQDMECEEIRDRISEIKENDIMLANVENPVEKLFRQQREKLEAEKNKALEEKDAALEEKDAALEEKDAVLEEKNAEIKNNKRNFIRSLYYDFHISKEEILEKYNDLTSVSLDEILA